MHFFIALYMVFSGSVMAIGNGVSKSILTITCLRKSFLYFLLLVFIEDILYLSFVLQIHIDWRSK
jgi:hypothetical protein